MTGNAKNIFLLVIFILPGDLNFAQSVSTLMGARGAGMGYATATLRDEWALLNNVGGLSSSKQMVAFAYDVRPGWAGANRIATLLSVALPAGVMGVGLFRFGDNLYNEQIISLGFSNQFGIASLGLKANYIQYRADGFGTRTAVSVNFGGIAQITPMALVGAYIININQARLSAIDKEQLPTKFVVGLSFKPTEKIILVAELEKDLAFETLLKVGIEYQVHKKFRFRSGFNLQPNAAFFGLGFLIKKLKIDYALQYNAYIAASNQVSIICPFEKTKTKRGK